MPRATRQWAATLFLALASLVVVLAASVGDSLVVYRVRPQDTDPAIQRFVDPHYVVFDRTSPTSADLLLFLSGSGGKPGGTTLFLNAAAGQGYRVISLAYNDTPAVVEVCARDPDPGCSSKVREKRIFGDGAARGIDDRPAESIVHRLVTLLAYLDRQHPDEGWGGYLDGTQPNWARIALSGHSQGAGMSAYIAQRYAVPRVILFSSPWDFFGSSRQMAPWIAAGPGATPAERWYGALHKKEATADLIARAYNALKIPTAHVRVLTLEPHTRIGTNPYHLSMANDRATPLDASGAAAYLDEWRFLLGTTGNR